MCKTNKLHLALKLYKIQIIIDIKYLVFVNLFSIKHYSNGDITKTKQKMYTNLAFSWTLLQKINKGSYKYESIKTLTFV